MNVIEIRKGQVLVPHERVEFSVRFRASFIDPVFRAEDQSIAQLEEITWQAYNEYRKFFFTQKASPEVGRRCRQRHVARER